MASVLKPEQTALLTAVLNCLIPAHDGLPGAGDLGLAAKIDALLTAAPSARRGYDAGLLAIDLASHRPFTSLDREEQEAVLHSVEASQPVFFAVLVEHAYRYYYTHPRVQRSVGQLDGPPQPHGHTLPAFDEQLLTIQRKREPFWRRTP